MSYQVFARKYRPKTFDDVLGQDHVVRTLKNAILQKRLAHAYLFVGPRGTGKTSTARIFAKALNCTGGPRVDFDPDESVCVEIAEGRSLDVLEIDGASNNGVEEVRQLRETVRFAPSSGQFKIYYIDEVHMLTNQAFNALLKTLEEPPEHVKFIFATTEPHKILPTILSRCQRFDLRPIPAETIAQHLLHIASEEGVKLDEAAAWAVAKGADGGMRDAQSMLDQLVAFCGDRITEANVLDVFGFTSRETVASLSGALLAKDTPTALSIVQREAEAGRELSQLLGEIIGCLRALLVARIDATSGGDGIPEDLWNTLVAAAVNYPADRLLSVIDVFAETEGRMKWASNKRLHLELGFIKAIQNLGELRISDVIKVLAGAADHLVLPAQFGVTTAAPPVSTAAAAPSSPAKPQPVAEIPSPEPVVETPAAREPEPVAELLVEPPARPERTHPAEVPPEPEFETEAEIISFRDPEPEPDRRPSLFSKDSPFDAFDNLIADAPEAHTEPEPVIGEAPPWKPDAPAEAPAAKADPMEEFYKDPLIQKALEMFEATIRK
ncbi:MAG: polymerase subunit gamma and tau [Akkermansiaceae bacterium]|nr:polymerase subunit gamma and tau [Akkermansiaceae bacterium]